jgi:hypothetical protein
MWKQGLLFWFILFFASMNSTVYSSSLDMDTPNDLQKKIDLVHRQVKVINKARYKLGLSGEGLCFPPAHYQNPDPEYHYDPIYYLGVLESDLKSDIELLQRDYSLSSYLHNKLKYIQPKPLIFHLGINNKLVVPAFTEVEFSKQLKSDPAMQYKIDETLASTELMAINREMDKYKDPEPNLLAPAPARSNAGLPEIREMISERKAKLWHRYSYWWFKDHPWDKKAPPVVIKTIYGQTVTITGEESPCESQSSADSKSN